MSENKLDIIHNWLFMSLGLCVYLIVMFISNCQFDSVDNNSLTIWGHTLWTAVISFGFLIQIYRLFKRTQELKWE